jgi:hypothetical protein
MRSIKNLGLVFLGALVGAVATVAIPRVGAQAITEVPSGQLMQPGQPNGTIITGDNIGFRLVGTTNRGDSVTGQLVIKINDRWLPVSAPTLVMPAR